MACLNHPLGSSAPSLQFPEQSESVLGAIPQALRGFLNNMTSMCLDGTSYEKCTACSKTVTQKFQEDRHGFLEHVFNSPDYLEDITGLTEMKETPVDWEPVEEDEFQME